MIEALSIWKEIRFYCRYKFYNWSEINRQEWLRTILTMEKNQFYFQTHFQNHFLNFLKTENMEFSSKFNQDIWNFKFQSSSIVYVIALLHDWNKNVVNIINFFRHILIKILEKQSFIFAFSWTEVKYFSSVTACVYNGKGFANHVTKYFSLWRHGTNLGSVIEDVLDIS